LTFLNALQNVRAVRRHGGHWLDSGEKQYPVRSRVANAWKALKYLANFGDRSDQDRTQVAAEFVLYSGGNFLYSLGAELGERTARFHSSSERSGMRPDNRVRVSPNSATTADIAITASTLGGVNWASPTVTSTGLAGSTTTAPNFVGVGPHRY
jgi:hypothetical protein